MAGQTKCRAEGLSVTSAEMWQEFFDVNVLSGVPVSLKEGGAKFVNAKRPSSVFQRIASTEEVANMVVYACSPQASATSGAALRVEDGIVDSIG